MTSIPLPVLPPSASASRLWRFAQLAGLAVTALLLVGLLVRPALTLRVLWDMVIPILPATFLVSPMVWRNVCPLATLNTLIGATHDGRIRQSTSRVSWVVGLVLLALLVPARRFLFNENGVALAITVMAVAFIALAAGAVLPRRSGFCNTLCPVLPVEKLYGQSPMVRVGSARCTACSVCTPLGCIDLAGSKAVMQTMGPSRRGYHWTTTSFGIFAAAFPGFIAGYFTLRNGPVTTALHDYVHVARYALTSWLIAVAIVGFTRIDAVRMLTVLGGASAVLYYWFAAPNVAAAYGAPVTAPAVIRLAAIGLVSAWLWVAWRQRVTASSRD